MERERHIPIEELEMFQRFVTIADWVWMTVQEWPALARDTVGKQLIRACDSIGANLVEGDGRYRDGDSLHFLIIARASARETRYWLNRALTRRLIDSTSGELKLDELLVASRMLNSLITYRRRRQPGDKVQEAVATYQLPEGIPLQSDFDDWDAITRTETEFSR